MGYLPDLAGTAAWIPFTAVSEAIMDVLFRSESPPLALNLAHPRPSRWTNIINAIRRAIIETRRPTSNADLRLVPFSKWFAQLEEVAQTANEETLQSIVRVLFVFFIW
jgi:hypothetical protein